MRLTAGWTVVIQILLSPLVAVVTLKLSFQQELKRTKINNLWKSRQEIYAEVFSLVFKTNRYMREIFIDAFISPNSASVKDFQNMFNKTNPHELEAIVKLIGDEKVSEKINTWVETKEEFSHGISLLQSGHLSNPAEKLSLKPHIEKAMLDCEQAGIDLRKEIRTTLGLKD